MASPKKLSKRPIPDELNTIVMKSLSIDKEERYPQASELGKALQAWLEGSKRQRQAIRLVEEAKQYQREAQKLQAQASTLQQKTKELKKALPKQVEETSKHPIWTQEDRAEKLLVEATLKELQAEQSFHSALTYAPDFQEAHLALATYYKKEHIQAEKASSQKQLARAKSFLETHCYKLPPSSEESTSFRLYLKGNGALCLETIPSNAKVTLYRFKRKNRRLQTELVESIGHTPIQNYSIPMGSYVAEIAHPDCELVRYPFKIERMQRWDGCPPNSTQTKPIQLPKKGQLQSDEIYVPCGWYLSGNTTIESLWSEGFVIKKYPVTNAEYLLFLDDLMKTGQKELALRCVPRERAGTATEQGEMIYGLNDKGSFYLRPDADGDIWHPQWPVVMLDYFCAYSYSQWFSQKTLLPWRLPLDGEWEKAYRGVDARIYPWGHVWEPNWSSSRDSKKERALPSIVDSYPIDQSPYGVRGLAGNAVDWCIAWDKDVVTQERIVQYPNFLSDYSSLDRKQSPRGGGWLGTGDSGKVTRYHPVETSFSYVDIGFRLLRPFPLI